MKVAVIGQSQRIHPMVDCAFHQSIDRARTIQQAVMRMAVQMGEWPYGRLWHSILVVVNFDIPSSDFPILRTPAAIRQLPIDD